MPTNKIFTVFDLGPGDGGKGGVIHKLTRHHDAHTVIKVGGAQGNHGVSNKRFNFAFSQWGCGTLEGVKTHITPLFVCSPIGLLNEAEQLRYVGVVDAFDMLTVDERTVCATPYHGIASRIKEVARGNNPRGTIGTGVGETHRDSITHPELTIRAADIAGDLRPKLEEIRDRQISALTGIIKELLDGSLSAEDEEIVMQEAHLLEDDGLLDYCVEQFTLAGKLVRVVPDNYIKEVFDRDGVAVVESSHGILTDNKFGFDPHVSAIRTLPSFTNQMLTDAGYDGEIYNVGVHRAYTIRHGAGPMPTADESMGEQLLPGSCKNENRYQGKVRVGPLDLVLLKYATDVCGVNIDGLAITWFDQILNNGTWHLCKEYETRDSQFFTSDWHIKENADEAEYQQKLTEALFGCVPKLSSIGNLPDSNEDAHRLCSDTLQGELGIPVYLISFGPTDQHKLVRN